MYIHDSVLSASIFPCEHDILIWVSVKYGTVGMQMAHVMYIKLEGEGSFGGHQRSNFENLMNMMS